MPRQHYLSRCCELPPTLHTHHLTFHATFEPHHEDKSFQTAQVRVAITLLRVSPFATLPPLVEVQDEPHNSTSRTYSLLGRQRTAVSHQRLITPSHPGAAHSSSDLHQRPCSAISVRVLCRPSSLIEQLCSVALRNQNSIQHGMCPGDISNSLF
jgi:hypothetical protein